MYYGQLYFILIAFVALAASADVGHASGSEMVLYNTTTHEIVTPAEIEAEETSWILLEETRHPQYQHPAYYHFVEYFVVENSGTPMNGWILKPSSGGSVDYNGSAKTIFVDDNASAGGDGTTWASAHKYLQDALADAEYGDEIWVAEGTYKPDQGAGKTAGERASPFVLVNGVGMYGGFVGMESTRDPQGDNNQTVLSGEINEDSEMWSFNVVSGADLDANTTLNGFRITKGIANGVGIYTNGGGIYLKDSDFTISNLVITNNTSSGAGGGIYASSSDLISTNCKFTNNMAGGSGGGITIGSSSTFTFTNCSFRDNLSLGWGGGISSDSDAYVNLTTCVFSNNYCDVLGGGIATSKSNITNCVFTGNVAGMRGGGISTDSSSTLTNCVIVGNSAAEKGNGGGIYSRGSLTLINCILWKNSDQGNVGSSISNPNEPWNSVSLEEGVEATYPGDPNARDAVYEPNLNILQGWDGDARAFDADPIFVNIDNPIGPDGIWFTEDDGLRIIAGSPAIDAGYNNALPLDSSDLDGDGNVTETIPYDVLGQTRRIGSKVDIGAYEFDPANPSPVVSLTAGSGGSVNGAGYFQEGMDANISATASTGYVFSNWSGDANGSSNPLTIKVDSAKSITANFAQDLNDTDGDGLTNYAELVTYGTKVDDNDTDNDGLLDNEEIQIGTDPNVSNLNIVNFFNSQAITDQDNARSAGQTTGIDMVKANPSTYGLYSSEDMNASVANAKSEGETSVTSNPSAYNLVTQSAYDEMMNELMSAFDGDTTPYSEGWFYLPNQGWLWTTRTTYPYFFDSTSKAWMYFQSGNEKPKFYHYGTKEWMTVE